MRGRYRLAVALIAAALAVTFVACSGGDGEGQLPRDVIFTPLAEEQPPQTVTVFEPDADLSELEGTAAELAQRLNAGLEATFRVRYTTSSDGEAGDEYLIYHDPPLTRIENIPAGSQSAASIVLARTGGRAVECVPGADGLTCNQLEPLESPPITAIGPVIFPAVEDLQQGDVRAAGEATVAGQSASCYQADLPNDQQLSYCLSEGGVVLSETAGSLQVEAQEFSNTVSEEDFLLPQQ